VHTVAAVLIALRSAVAFAPSAVPALTVLSKDRAMTTMGMGSHATRKPGHRPMSGAMAKRLGSL
jgi:hypothetical protein